MRPRFEGYTCPVNHSRRTAAFAAVALLFAAATLVLTLRHVEQQGSFKAFYCAGRAVAAGQDPYRVQPLEQCEKAVVGSRLAAGEVEPAPLPGYGLAAYAALSHLPYRTAAAVYQLSAFAATLAAALLLSGITGLPAAAILLILLPLALLNMAYGEPPVFTMFAIVLAGWALRRQQWALVAAATALALIQPHIGGAIVLSLFILMPPARLPLLAALGALLVISVAALGPAVNWEYAHSVLPAQAISELPAADQYSLSHLLYAAGLPAMAALGAGEASTLAMIVIGIAGARYAARRLNSPELLVYLPPAAVLLFGVYLHDIQFIAALPLGIAAAARVEAVRRPLCWLALAALAVVWSQRGATSVLVLDIAAVAAAAVVTTVRAPARSAAAGLALGVLAAIVIVALHGRFEPNLQTTMALAPVPWDLASHAWAEYLRATPGRVTETLAGILLKVPSWFGIAVLLSICIVPPVSERVRARRLSAAPFAGNSP